MKALRLKISYKVFLITFYNNRWNWSRDVNNFTGKRHQTLSMIEILIDYELRLTYYGLLRKSSMKKREMND